ncbi:MAG: hypothetical protein KAQ90_10220 [Melioribacteraceae bacterium]|nr:hypothetical protein [Melioribacteraceae bacterium]
MKFKFITIILMFISVNLFAQDFLGILSYNTALPMGNTSEFISEYSWKGFSFEGRTFTNRAWAFGGIFGWNVFNEMSTDLAHIDRENSASDVKGTQVRYINSFPIMASGHYYFGRRRSALRLFFGVGVGVYYITQRFEIGVFGLESNNWHFGLAPEAGFLFSLGRTTALSLSAKYNYAFDAGNNVFGEPDNAQSYLGINIGLAFYGY